MGTRARFDLVAEMLILCKAGVSQTRLIRKCNLSYETYLKYRKLLLTKKFIEKRGYRYFLTFRGEIFLAKLNAVFTVWNGIPSYSEIVIDPSIHSYASEVRSQ